MAKYLLVSILCCFWIPSFSQKEEVFSFSIDSCYKEGCLAFEQKDYAKAVLLFQDIKNQMEKEHDYGTKYISILNLLANSYSHIDPRKSIIIGEELLTLCRTHNVADTLLYLSNLAHYYSHFDDTASLGKAKKYNEEVLCIREKSLDTNDYRLAISYKNQARIEVRLKKVDRALSYMKKVLAITEKAKGKSSHEYAMNLGIISSYYMVYGDTINAIQYARRANDIYEDIETLHNLSLLYEEAQNEDSCYYYSEKLYQRIRKIFLSDIMLLSYDSRKHFIYDGESRIFFESFFHRATVFSSPKFAKLSYNCALLYKHLLLNSEIKIRNAIIKSGNSELITLYNDYVKLSLSKNQEFEKVENNLLFNIQKLGTKNIILSPSWKNVQDILKKNDVAVEIISAEKDDCFYVFLLRNYWDSPKVIKLDKNNILSALRGEGWTEDKLPLYDYIWKEIVNKGQIKEGENIFFAPDDFLQVGFPIECVMDYDGFYMLEKYNMYRLSCTSNIGNMRLVKKYNSAILYGGLLYNVDSKELDDERKRYTQSRSILFNKEVYNGLREKSNYLPWTKIEIDSINNIMKSGGISDVYVLDGAHGIEESFKNLSGDSPDIIHVATHGFYNTNFITTNVYENSCLENAGLLMAGVLNTEKNNLHQTTTDDGILRGNEICFLDLSNTDIVVLSACDTGKGGITPDGISGLQRAFKLAGVDTIIMALGKVEDAATSYFMTSFYEELIKSGSKHDAFVNAQRLVRQKYDDHYAYWAWFVMLD